MKDIKKTKAWKPKLITGNPDTTVKVTLQMDDKTREAWLLVQVESHMRPGLWGRKKINADQDRDKLKYLVKQAAEHIALYQCEAYKDPHNPFAAGKAAVEALEEVLAQAERANKKVISIPKA